MYKVGIIGLGYVGLPLATEVGKLYSTIGLDINQNRINDLKNAIDSTLEVEADDLKLADKLSFTSKGEDLQDCNFYIVTVPTPIDSHKKPDLGPLIRATEGVGQVLTQGDIVVYESTVYPGCTEEVCVPILEELSGLTFNKDFYCGYSPERINPGDKVHRLTTIKKVTSGSTPEISRKVDDFYSSFITAGTYQASSIKVAEAAKVIENAQRDINIAFINELAHIFQKLELDTNEVLEAAQTKWNFLPFKPGLVGGHCIGVDPYYLAYKSEEVGYQPHVILSGRKVNDNMGSFVAQQVIKQLSSKRLMSPDARALILGFTFKENCPDIRNTRVVDIYREFQEYGIEVQVFDPYAEVEAVKSEYGIEALQEVGNLEDYQSIVVAVAHDQFKEFDWKEVSQKVPVIFDIKGILPRELVVSRL